MNEELMLISKIKDAYKFDEKYVVSETVNIKDVSFIKLRDILNLIGTIEQEDLENRIYTVSIKAGFFNMNTAIMAVKYSKDKLEIKAFAKEGIIKQNTATQAIEKLIERL